MEEKISLTNEIESIIIYALSKLESSDVFNFEDKDYWFFYSLDKQLEQISIDIKTYHAAKSTQ